jgi:hypothetical protein
MCTFGYSLKSLEDNRRLDCFSKLNAKKDVTFPNERVKMNIVLLRRFINAVCRLTVQELPFRGHDGVVRIFKRRELCEVSQCAEMSCSVLENYLNSTKGI